MPVIEDQLESRLGDYYLERIRIHMDDTYAGIRMRKFPEDLRTLEQILWDCQLNVVLEIGLGLGGSALWFRDRLRTLVQYGRVAQPLVISVDADISQGRENLARVDPDYAETIRLVESDVRDPEVVEKVNQHLPPNARVLLIDDSAHRYDTTLATLRSFSSVVPLKGYVLIEDGHRDLPGMLPAEIPGHAHGVVQAIAEWLASDGAGRFVQRREQERYIVTSNPGGWLQRIR
jgi:cephalosporin hydroxylase